MDAGAEAVVGAEEEEGGPGSRPEGEFPEHRVLSKAAGGVRCVGAGEDVHPGCLAGEENGEVPDEGEDALAVLGEEIGAWGDEDEGLEVGEVEDDLVDDAEEDCQDGV